jgi:hypothetical protein
MDLFKFNPVTDPTILESGEFINNVDSIMWTERYAEPGEFELQAPLSSGLREFLPLGTLISHVDTPEVMIVENHQIGEKTQEDPTLTVTGRSFETFLENRIVGVNLARASSTIAEYILSVNSTATQAVQVINDHINLTRDPNDALTNILVSLDLRGSAGTDTRVARTMNRDTVHKALLDILAVDDLGIKTIRRNTFTNILGGSSTQTTLLVHRGTDNSAKVIFSWKGGDLDTAEYLFSDKRLKNSALVVGRYVYTVVDTGPTKYDRRIMIVPADDIDGNLSAPPTGTALTTLLGKLTVRGQQALRNQNRVTISRTDISKLTNYEYRRDFNVGDLVSIDGNFGQIAVMRVVEYVEIEDQNGESGHPTLSLPGA